MAKSFKKFRESKWDDDEWGSEDDNHERSKEQRMEKRRNKRKMKYNERLSRFKDEEFKKRK